MKKILFVFGLLFSFYGSVMGQPGVVGVEKAVYEERTVAYEGDCISVSFNLGKNLIVIGCDDYNYNSWKTNVVIRKICGSGFFDLFNTCRYEIRYFINGEYIDKQTLNTSSDSKIINVLPIDMNKLADKLGKEYKEKTADLTIEIWEMCSVRGGTFENKKQTITQTLQVVNYDPNNEENNQYVVSELVGTYSKILCEDEIYQDRQDIIDNRMCCSGEKTLTIDNIETIGNELSISGGIGIPSKFVLKGLLSEKIYKINKTTVKNSYIFNIKATKGHCIYPAIQLNFDKYVKYYRYVVCDGDDTVGDIIEEYDELTDIQKSYCETENPCGELPPYKIKIRNREIVNREIASGCIGDILFDFEYEGENYEYEWTGPSGEKYYTKNLIGVPYGKYELTIYDECCNEHNETVNLCDEMNYINWEYKNGEYCADVVCACSSEDTDPLNYIMCVTPHRYDSDWSFDDSRKKCTKHAYWTDQNGVEIDLTDAVNEDDIDAEDENVVKEPEVIEYFDESSKQCIREYRCEDDNSQGSIEQEDPEYGDWQYDDFYEKCYREVFCFGDDDPAEDEDGWEVKDEGDSEIEWDFDEDDYMCYGIVYCDDDETDIEVEEDPDAVWYWDDDNNECTTDEVYCDDAEQDGMSEEGDDFGDWEYNGSDCYRSVFCNLANEKFTDYAEEVKTNYDSEWENQCGDDECTYYITCDGDEISHDYYLCGGCPEGLIKGEYLIDKSHLTKGKPILLSGKNVIYSKKKKSYKYYKIQIYTIDGKINKFVGKKRVKDVEAFISFFKKYKARPNIMYFYLVFGENELLYSKKFIEFKK